MFEDPENISKFVNSKFFQTRIVPQKYQQQEEEYERISFFILITKNLGYFEECLTHQREIIHSSSMSLFENSEKKLLSAIH